MPDWTCPRCGRSFLRKNVRHSCVSRTPEAFFAPYPKAYPLFEAVRDLLQRFGEVEVEALKTQVSFRARKRFAYLWIPAMSLGRGPPDLYLTLDLPRRVDSPRFKEVVQVRGSTWAHHMLLSRKKDLDAEARGWLREAYEVASVSARRTG